MKNYLLIVLSAAFMFIAGCKEKPVTVEIKKPMNEAFEEKRIQLLSNYTYIDPFSTDEGVARVEKDAKYGYIDSTGKEIVPVTNYNVQSFSEGLGLVEESEGSFYFVDKTGKKIIDLSAYSNAFSFADGYSTVEKHDHYGRSNSHRTKL